MQGSISWGLQHSRHHEKLTPHVQHSPHEMATTYSCASFCVLPSLSGHCWNAEAEHPNTVSEGYARHVL
jgi:hypothetical protein